MAKAPPDFFATPTDAPPSGHRWAELLTGPSTIYGKWTCVKGSSLGTRYSYTGITDEDRAQFKNVDTQTAHSQLYGCQIPYAEEV